MDTIRSFDKFLEKDKEIRVQCQLDGIGVAAMDKAVADYFGMSLRDYRSARHAAFKARTAARDFTLRYFTGTHPDMSVAEAAAKLGYPIVTVKKVTD